MGSASYCGSTCTSTPRATSGSVPITGTWIRREQATDPAYWAKHASHTARFDDALRELWRFENPILLEAGPGRTLGVLAMQHPDRRRAGDPLAVASIRHHYENRPDGDYLWESIGRLWLSGVAIKWENARPGDMDVNPTREKKLTNMRSKGSDENIQLEPARELTLEAALEYIEDDELIEVTPKSIRLRKRFLATSDRKRLSREARRERERASM